MILDRLNGLVTFPGFLYSKPFVMPFDEIRAARGGMYVGLSFFYWGGLWRTAIHMGMYSEGWSFIVWYMDKNRPLPPGDAFDPYREADYQRRKAAGFPLPLYWSLIDTPEPPEHQREIENNKEEEFRAYLLQQKEKEKS